MTHLIEPALLYETCLVRLLKQRAEAIPDRPYFTCEGETLSYGALWQRAGRMALALARSGVAAGELVAAISHNSTSLLVLFHACLRLGAVFAPLNVSLREDDLARTLARLSPQHLILSEEMAGEHRAVVDALVPSIHIGMIESYAATEPHASQPPEHHWKAGEWSWIIFSGATTGLPKAIRLPHAYALSSGQRLVEAIGLTPGDRFFSVLQLCHGWLNFPVLVGCLLAEAHCGNVRWFSASKWLDQVRSFGATAVDVFLPMAGALMARPRQPGERDHAIRVCIGAMGSVGEIDRLSAFEERFGITSVNIYGVTEGGGLATTENLGDIRRHGSVGKPTSHFEVMVADEQGRAVPVGQHGEILMRPTLPCIMSLGYLGEADKTLDTWRDLWIHSADLGYFDEDGYLYFTGRQPHWLRRKGENVSAREVEDALRTLPGVADAAVIGVASPLGDEDIKAFVVPDTGVDLLPAAIHQTLRTKLAAFKLPRYIEIVADFARTIKAEPDRKSLRAPGLSGHEWDGEARAE